MSPNKLFNKTLNKSLNHKFASPCQNFSYLLSQLNNTDSPDKALYIIITPEPILNIKLSQEVEFFRQQETPLLYFPDWETLPYDHFSPQQEIISERLKTLFLLPQITHGILFISITTLMQRLCPAEFIGLKAFYLKSGDMIDLTALKLQCIKTGYQLVSQVIAPGEFAVRGSLIDIFPMGHPIPFRIDLLGNEIETIRAFDPETQRSLNKIDKIDLLPAHEFPSDKDAIELFRKQWREHFEGNPVDCPVYETVSQGGLVSGIEYYFPLFFEKTASFFDYLPDNTVFIKLNKTYETAENYWTEIKSRYESLRYDRTRPLLPPEKLFLNAAEVFTRIKSYANFSTELSYEISPDIFIDHKLAHPFEKIKTFISESLSHQKRLLFCAESAGRREALLSLFRQFNQNTDLKIFNRWEEFIHNPDLLGLITAPIEEYVCLNINNISIILIPENILLGEQLVQSRRKKTKFSDRDKMDQVIKNLAELTIGAPVVHLDHGVGRYQGLQTLALHDQLQEFLVLEYADQAKLYVPVTHLDLISRYSGLDAEHAPLHRLGTDHWEKARKKAAEQVTDVAAELLEIHAKREMRKGITHPITPDYILFAESFGFEETPDQQQAIENVMSDMQSSKSMDRLICGDVGFGKTEVAMRAAFIAVQNGYQVSVLVPTTLLAQQHFQNFSDRFAPWPVKVEVLSRFKSLPEQTKILQNLQNGQVDIIIGTHKLLQPGIIFKKLGLLIIDEEHRFGVRQKEKLKSLRAEVDILTLTATPIPRTLNMSMASMRDLSIISTPPARRLSIKTFVHKYDLSLVREAVLREILRGGQVYYLHNAVDTMLNTAEKLKETIPEARIAIAHGQMPERELERIMREFYHQHHNVLICSTIIETGIDIPSANTIIIDRADKFGLAQLHQLRGRVGRSHHQAYAYLLIPSQAGITNDAKKRLEAITQLEDLGAGFALATHDLEIRGAGEILGDKQSGNMQEIGFSLYMDLLDRAIKTLKKIKSPEFSSEFSSEFSVEFPVDIDLQIPALIPDSYLPDAHTRLVLYKRLASCRTSEALDEFKVEFIDRFGVLPPQTQNLFALAYLKLKIQHYPIKKIQANSKSSLIIFHENTANSANLDHTSTTALFDPLKIIHLIQNYPMTYKLEGQHKIRLSKPQPEPQDKIKHIQEFLSKISTA